MGFSSGTFALAAVLAIASAANAATITDASTFAGFSVTYDDAFGPLLFPHEADSFTGTLPVSQFGFGRFFLDPAFAASSDGSTGPGDFTASGQIVLTAKPGWGLYDTAFIQSGQWTTTGTGSVSVAGSLVDVTAPDGQFFFTDQRAFAHPLTQTSDGAAGYYYVFGERSSLTAYAQMTIDYDIHLQASANGGGFARIANDASDLNAFFASPTIYPESNVVGTFISVAYERVSAVPEPSTIALLVLGYAALPVRRAWRS